MSTPIETVQSIYQAFGRGDVPSILSTLDRDVRWEDWADHSAQRAGVPYLQPHRGPDAAMEFFKVLGGLQIHEFKVLDVIGGPAQAAAEVVIDFTVPSTGVRIRDEEMHLWSFGADGKVVRFRHYVDTAKHMRACGLLAA